jgi:hypothetical protein
MSLTSPILHCGTSRVATSPRTRPAAFTVTSEGHSANVVVLWGTAAVLYISLHCAALYLQVRVNMRHW